MKEIPKYIHGSDGAAFIEGKRYLQRVHDKRPPLWPWGTALLLGLLLLTLIAIWPFAQGSIQQRAQISAQAALEDGGFEWAEASANGQWVHLTGTPPSIVAGENAEKAVRAARTRTWLGQAKPITRVTTDYVGAEAPSTSTPEPAAATPETVFNNWEFEREGEALTLTGDVPTQAVRTQIVDLAGQSPNVTGITRISDQLVITETPLPEGYLHDTEIGIEALKRCDSGKVTLLKRVLDLRCTLPTAKQARLESLLNQDLLLAEYGTVEVLTSETVSSCNTTIRRLLEASQVRFETGQATISDGSSMLLDQMAEAARTCPGRIMIEGHTDASGRNDANLTLSQQRADAVMQALVTRGLDTNRLFTQGFGSAQPIATNETSAGRAQNRRIEMRIMNPNE